MVGNLNRISREAVDADVKRVIKMDLREFRDELGGRGLNWSVRIWCLRVHKNKQ